MEENNPKETLTYQQAYDAMFFFLEDYYYRVGKPDAIGIFLGQIEPLEGKATRDPAAWQDWLDAIKKSEQEPSRKQQDPISETTKTKKVDKKTNIKFIKRLCRKYYRPVLIYSVIYAGIGGLIGSSFTIFLKLFFMITLIASFIIYGHEKSVTERIAYLSSDSPSQGDNEKKEHS